MLDEYLARIAPYFTVDAPVFRSEAALATSVEKGRGRAAPVSVLLDSRGTAVSSEGFAGMLSKYQDGGTQLLVFAVGPADGWSEGARGAAGRLLSFGPMTFPHELARVMLAEQLYRACTILAGHPYHSGH